MNQKTNMKYFQEKKVYKYRSLEKASSKKIPNTSKILIINKRSILIGQINEQEEAQISQEAYKEQFVTCNDKIASYISDNYDVRLLLYNTIRLLK